MKKSFHITTYGCKMNEHESEKLSELLLSLGYVKCKNQREADIIIFNSCCIRDTAENRAMGNIGKLKGLKREFPKKIIAVGGCMPEQNGVKEKIKKTFPFVDILVGTEDFLTIADKLEKREIEKSEFPTENGINIILGCNNFCSYCIVPYVRGRERSISSKIILKQIEALSEVTLLGQNVNSYICPETNINFAELLRRIPKSVKVSFLTSHPKDFSDEVIDVIAKNENISRTIHLPVQSGSNNILKAMNRKYTREHYLNLIKKIRAKIKDADITTDIIVGFPGETEEDYQDTVDLVKTVQYNSAFIFMYNKRSGTVAATMQNQIPLKVKRERINNLINIQREISNKRK